MIGVYKITNTVNGKLYIGSSVNITIRIKRHFKDLQQNKHHCKPLQRAYNKHGAGCFISNVLELIPHPSGLINKEQYWIDKLTPAYNTCKIAGNALGVKHTPNTVLKNKQRNTGFGNGNSKITPAMFNEIKNKRPFNSIHQLAAEYGVHKSTISRILKRHHIKPMRVCTPAGRMVLSELAKNRRNRANPVNQYTLDGVFIASYPSATDASNHTGISVNQIIDCCKRRVKRPRRFVFTYQ